MVAESAVTQPAGSEGGSPSKGEKGNGKPSGYSQRGQTAEGLNAQGSKSTL